MVKSTFKRDGQKLMSNMRELRNQMANIEVLTSSGVFDQCISSIESQWETDYVGPFAEDDRSEEMELVLTAVAQRVEKWAVLAAGILPAYQKFKKDRNTLEDCCAETPERKSKTETYLWKGVGKNAVAVRSNIRYNGHCCAKVHEPGHIFYESCDSVVERKARDKAGWIRDIKGMSHSELLARTKKEEAWTRRYGVVSDWYKVMKKVMAESASND